MTKNKTTKLLSNRAAIKNRHKKTQCFMERTFKIFANFGGMVLS